MIKLLTDWLTIGTAGPTTDGRDIKKKWLTDAAETYDPDEYTAVANAEHWFGNFGSVRELRTVEDKKGRTVLQARLRPNKYYLQQNSEDLRLFFSMELTHNFAGTGKTYLTGLATTDRPASLGTTEAHFSRVDNEQLFRGGEAEISGSQLLADDNKPLVAAVVAGIKDFFTSTHKKQEETDMTEEQVKTLLSAEIKPLAEGITSLNSNIEQVLEKFGKPDASGSEAGAGTGAPAAGTVEAGKTGAGEPGTAFETLFKESFGKLNESVGALTEKLNQALQGKGKNIPAGTGAETAPDFV